MTDPITPPPELVQQWLGDFFGCTPNPGLSSSERFLATKAAQWGADQELEACCEWIPKLTPWDADKLRAARRKPPSLKEQALDDFNGLMQELDGAGAYSNCANRIRRALEALPND